MTKHPAAATEGRDRPALEIEITEEMDELDGWLLSRSGPVRSFELSEERLEYIKCHFEKLTQDSNNWFSRKTGS